MEEKIKQRITELEQSINQMQIQIIAQQGAVSELKKLISETVSNS